MEGEIVNTVDEPVKNNEFVNTSLSVGDAGMTTLVREKLEEKGYGIDKLVDMAIEVAEFAETAPRGEGGIDYGKKLKAIQLMMEAGGYIKRKGGTEVKFNLQKFLYSNN